MEYIKVSEAAKNWNISPRRVRILCSQNKIEGVIKQGKLYMIPSDAKKPADERTKETKILALSGKNSFQSLNEKKNLLSQLREPTPVERRALKEEFLISFTYNSLSLEGSPFTEKEVASIFRDSVIPEFSLKDHMDICGFRDAFLYGEKLIRSEKLSKGKTLSPMSAEAALTLHSILQIRTPEDKGTYRKIPVHYGHTYDETAEPSQIEKKLKELFKLNEKRKKDMHIIDRLALFKVQFDSIHPFIEGTEKVGKILVNLDLISNGYPPLIIPLAEKASYYAAFQQYTEDENHRALSDLYCKWVEVSLNKYTSILSEEGENNDN